MGHVDVVAVEGHVDHLAQDLHLVVAVVVFIVHAEGLGRQAGRHVDRLVREGDVDRGIVGIAVPLSVRGGVVRRVVDDAHDVVGIDVGARQPQLARRGVDGPYDVGVALGNVIGIAAVAVVLQLEQMQAEGILHAARIACGGVGLGDVVDHLLACGNGDRRAVVAQRAADPCGIGQRRERHEEPHVLAIVAEDDLGHASALVIFEHLSAAAHHVASRAEIAFQRAGRLLGDDLVSRRRLADDLGRHEVVRGDAGQVSPFHSLIRRLRITHCCHGGKHHHEIESFHKPYRILMEHKFLKANIAIKYETAKKKSEKRVSIYILIHKNTHPAGRLTPDAVGPGACTPRG